MSDFPYKAMDTDAATVNLAGDAGALVLRLTVCSLVVHHGLQKFQNPEGFAENIVAVYFSFLPVPLFWTYVAATIETVGALLLVLGVFARLAAFCLLGTMVFANTFHFLATGLEGYPLGVPATGAYAFEPSLLCFGIFFYFLLAGPGKFSLKPSWF